MQKEIDADGQDVDFQRMVDEYRQEYAGGLVGDVNFDRSSRIEVSVWKKDEERPSTVSLFALKLTSLLLLANL